MIVAECPEFEFKTFNNSKVLLIPRSIFDCPTVEDSFGFLELLVGPKGWTFYFVLIVKS